MIDVGRLAGVPDADEAYDIRGGVGDGVIAVRDDADGPGRVAEDQLRERDRQIEDEDASENACNGFVARERQKTFACAIGHQRSWTLPIMYFLGTKPQCRLSELLFRWSPITK